MKKQYLHTLGSRVSRIKGGSKAKNLHFLVRHHYPVPPGWVLSWDALADFKRCGPPIMEKIRLELSQKLIPGQTYAVRSSASVEDDSDYSCAGLFRSFLGADGLDQVVDSIRDVWKSVD